MGHAAGADRREAGRGHRRVDGAARATDDQHDRGVAALAVELEVGSHQPHRFGPRIHQQLADWGIGRVVIRVSGREQTPDFIGAKQQRGVHRG